MSDNPNDSELLDLGVQVDPSGFTSLEQLREYLEQLYQTSIDLAMQGSEKAAEFANSLREIIDASSEETSSLDGLKTQVNELAQSYTRVEEAAQSATEAIKEVSSAKGYDINAQALGYGVAGGMIGPEEDTGEGGGVGSAFAIGHGLSVAGHATGSPLLREAGGLVYIEESLRRVGPLFTQLNTSLEVSGGLVPALTSGLVAANIPMAGLIATLAPLAVAAIAAAIAIKSIIDKLNEGKEAINAALAGLDTYYKAIQTGTTESITAEIDKLQTGIAAHKQYADQLQNELTIGELAAAKQGILAEQEYNHSAATQALRDKLAELQKGIDSDTASVAALTTAANSAAVAINDLMVAADKHRKDYLEEANLAQMSSSALENHAKGLQNNIAAIDSEIDYLQQSGDTSKETQDKLKELNAERLKESNLLTYVTSVLEPLIRAREQEIGQYKALRQAAEDRRTEIEREGADYLAQQNAIRDAKKKQEDEAVKDTLKYNADIQKANDEEAQAKLDIQQKYADKVKELVEKAQQEAQTDYEKLLYKQADLRQAAFNDEEKMGIDAQQKAVDLEVKANRDERDAYTAHLQKLNDINKQFQNQGEQDLLDRNFLGLVKLRKTHTDQTSAEDQHYADQDAKIKQHLSDEESDLARHLAFERQQRERALTLALSQAWEGYQREITQLGEKSQREIVLAQETEQRELNLAVQKATNKINLLNQEYRAELNMVFQTETEKLRIYQQALAQVRAMGYAVGGGIQTISPTSPQSSIGTGGGVIRRFAEGGPFEAYRAFMMSEKSPETLNVGGGAYNVGGAALVYPLQSGNVDKNGSGRSVVINNYITGFGAEDIHQKVLDVMEKVMPQ